MKKRNVFAMLAITIFSSVLGLVGCGKAECAHIWNEGVITTDATGMVALLYFSPDGNTMTVRYYSTTQEFYGSASSQFTVSLTK